ncbi:helix-turn-helix domain-containing protein [Streptomyces sp. NPDC058305]|uniref:helix-turn-helix domain-containing protein n=1 Tax=Streptomyces sp. NPDC058305 TaxID=3346438 RepID=UPI0036ECB937
MGRRENPIGECGKSLRTLVTWLRSGREATGLSYTQLAEHCEFSADTLARAASGRGVPRRPVVMAFARVCGLDELEAERLWKQARRDEAQIRDALAGRQSSMDISVVKNFAHLHSALLELYRNEGKPALRELNDRVGGQGRLPPSTTSRVLKGTSKPSRPFVLAFAQACGVRESVLPEWQHAWERAHVERRQALDRFRRRRHESQKLLTHHDQVSSRDLQQLMSDLEAAAVREPGLRLKVHFPETRGGLEADRSARMKRERIVDQAQQRGELSCPTCQRPSFGYTDGGGWGAVPCAECTGTTIARRAPDHLASRRRELSNEEEAAIAPGRQSDLTRYDTMTAPATSTEPLPALPASGAYSPDDAPAIYLGSLALLGAKIHLPDPAVHTDEDDGPLTPDPPTGNPPSAYQPPHTMLLPPGRPADISDPLHPLPLHRLMALDRALPSPADQKSHSAEGRQTSVTWTEPFTLRGWPRPATSMPQAALPALLVGTDSPTMSLRLPSPMPATIGRATVPPLPPLCIRFNRTPSCGPETDEDELPTAAPLWRRWSLRLPRRRRPSDWPAAPASAHPVLQKASDIPVQEPSTWEAESVCSQCGRLPASAPPGRQASFLPSPCALGRRHAWGLVL